MTVEVCAVTNYKVVWGLTVSLAPAVEPRGGKVANGLVGVEALFTPTVECCQNCLRSERYWRGPKEARTAERWVVGRIK